jgi:hypothetical protein
VDNTIISQEPIDHYHNDWGQQGLFAFSKHNVIFKIPLKSTLQKKKN